MLISFIVPGLESETHENQHAEEPVTQISSETKSLDELRKEKEEASEGLAVEADRLRKR